MGKKLPETSIEAFRSLDPTKLSETKRQILYALSQIIQGTQEDIAAYLRVDRDVIWKRLSELEKDGLIFKPGIKKALRSGRLGFVYQLTDKSDQKTIASERALKGRSVSEYARSILTTAN